MTYPAFVRVYDGDGGFADVEADDEPRIDAAVQQYVDSGGTRDTLLDLTMVTGAPYRVLASTIRGWTLSTPQIRLRTAELEKAGQDEERQNRIAVGLPWEES